MSGLTRLGRISFTMTLAGRIPCSSAALTKSRSDMSSVADRSTRATCGACEKPTAIVISHSFGPSRLSSSRAKTICGKDRITSTDRMMIPSLRPRR